MIFRQLFDSVSCTYTYVLADKGEAVVIDPVFEHHQRDAALLRELGLRPTVILDTHVHADHVTGAWLMREAFGASIAMSGRAGARGADRELSHGETVAFGDTCLSVRATPGHTSGCTTFVLEDESRAFTGDCLLIRGAGRTDFQQGDAATLYRSITEQVLTLPDGCLLYPAHDYSGRTVTTVLEERTHNPRVGGRADEGDFVGFMGNLGLPHPKRIDEAVPANLELGRPKDGVAPATPDWAPLRRTYAGIWEVDPEWVVAHRADVTILDVREPPELTDPGGLGVIDGVIHVPLGELGARAAEVPQDKPVVAVCRSGRRSAQATVILKRAGRERVANLEGGMLHWREIDGPVAV